MRMKTHLIIFVRIYNMVSWDHMQEVADATLKI